MNELVRASAKPQALEIYPSTGPVLQPLATATPKPGQGKR
jgi:hypothetical protein